MHRIVEAMKEGREGRHLAVASLITSDTSPAWSCLRLWSSIASCDDVRAVMAPSGMCQPLMRTSSLMMFSPPAMGDSSVDE